MGVYIRIGGMVVGVWDPLSILPSRSKDPRKGEEDWTGNFFRKLRYVWGSREGKSEERRDERNLLLHELSCIVLSERRSGLRGGDGRRKRVSIAVPLKFHVPSGF